MPDYKFLRNVVVNLNWTVNYLILSLKKTRNLETLLKKTKKIEMDVLVLLLRILAIATPYLDLNGPPGKQCPHEVNRRDCERVNTVLWQLEHLVEAEFQEEGHQADRFLPNGSTVKVMIEVLIMEEGKEGVGLTVLQEGLMGKEVSNCLCKHNTHNKQPSFSHKFRES